jgi:hypothetical protein
MHAQGINIFSGEPGLGGALTNPTELSRQKGSIDRPYRVLFRGKDWADAESAYQVLGASTHNAGERDILMAELIAAKFSQHPNLLREVVRRGGVPFLQACSHFTGARTPQAQSWEGQGEQSRFIRNLVAGFILADSNEALTEMGQGTLF